MDRRTFVKTGVGASLGVAVRDASAAPKRKHPNILYVFADQHRAVSLPGEPFSHVAAPNLEKFRAANMSMDQCLSNYPLCVPYRSILMSGRYPAQTGVLDNAHFLPTSEFTITKAFKASGYWVGYVGKWHLKQPDDATAVFISNGPYRFQIDDWHVWDNTNDKYHCWTYNHETGEKIVATKWAPTNQTDQAIELMNGYAKNPEQPWMLFISWNPPHPAYNPPQEDRDKNPIPEIKLRPNVKMEPKSETPWMRKDPNFHTAIQGYEGGITGVDGEFGRLLTALDATGMTDDTIVIYTSDHGDMLASHGRTGKVVPHEESCHVPFMIRYPGVTPQGASSKELFAAINIYPTLCGMAGVPVPASCAGRDLSGLLRGRKHVDAPDHMFLMAGAGGARTHDVLGEHEDADSPTRPPHYRGLRTARYTYAVSQESRWLLFDRQEDPYELKDLSSDPQHAELMQGFDEKIKVWLKQTGDAFVYPKLV